MSGGPAGQGARLCLCLAASTLQRNAELLRRERARAELDLAELRADFLQPDELPRLARFPALAGQPVILSLRRAADGGRWRGAEADRRRLLRQALGSDPGAAGYSLVEVEQDVGDAALEQAARARGCRLIRSCYDLRGVPADLAARLRRLVRRGGARGRPGGPDLPKAAVQVRGSRDQRRLAEAFRELENMEKILLGLGEYGLFSRLLAGRLGSWLAYVRPGEAEEAREQETPAEPERSPLAAELPDARTLLQRYRFRRVGPRTAVYGVVGNPIAHSRSPHLHNAGYDALGLDAVYVPFLADRLPALLRAAEALGVRGLSVTVPFKEQALRLARAAGAMAVGESGLLSAAVEEARAAGAANTLLRCPAGGARSGRAGLGRGGGRRGAWRAANTDAAGFLAPLERQAPELLQAGAAAAVLGAGGAARAVVRALTRRGLKVLVLNRTPARARKLARRFGAQWAALDPREAARLGERQLIVQTTTVGLDGLGDPLPECAFRAGQLVYELLYGPAPTPFLARARAAGCRTIDGMAMLQAQAEAQFRLFTGREPPPGGLTGAAFRTLET